MLLLEVHAIDLMIAEINLSGQDGTGFFEQLRQMHPQSSVLVHTDRPSISQAVNLTRLGAIDYIEKDAEAMALSALPGLPSDSPSNSKVESQPIMIAG